MINKLFSGLFLEKNGNDDFFPAFIYDNGLRVVPHFLWDSWTERVKYSNVSENRCVRGEARRLEWKETEGFSVPSCVTFLAGAIFYARLKLYFAWSNSPNEE